jgi:formate dehydrogenase iron-sulfur subunit
MSVAAFLTDPSLCIGCKACEVACKEWNELPQDGYEWSGLSYDNTRRLGASTWRHVLFLEQPARMGAQIIPSGEPFRWVFLSDVCKHCEVAGCLEACPTGAIVRTEAGSVYVQPDVCNGCGYCVPACPFGVIERRADDGRVFKCTFSYDRQRAGLIPACAKACPTQSIRYGELAELRGQAKQRVDELHRRGFADARIYDPQETSVRGVHALFVLLGEPEAYNFPPAPEAPTMYLQGGWTAAAISAIVLFAVVCLAFAF